MAYQVTEELRTGNFLIDQEHQELFNAINRLLDACKQGKGRAELKSAIDFFQSYTEKHFSDEESLQSAAKYPKFVVHRGYHDTYKTMVATLCKKFEQEGPTIAMVQEVNSTAAWLVNHIKVHDREMAAYLKEHS
jgi:hemerythrin